MRISREKVNHISKIIIDDLEKREDFDYKAELNEVRLEITHVMNEYLKVEDRADENARKVCASYSKKLREGQMNGIFYIISKQCLKQILILI